MRSFLAVPCDDSLRSSLETIQGDIPVESGVKFVTPENLHLSIKFLGDITQDQRRRLDSGLQRELPTTGPLQLSVRGLGIFPDPGNPRVIWAGVEDHPDLMKIQESCEQVAERVGVEPENRDYIPHITLGRVKRQPDDKQSLVRFIRETGQDEFGVLDVESIWLFESELTSEGPIYSKLESWPL